MDIQPLDPKIFFFSYLVDHYFYKQATFKLIIDDYEKQKKNLLSALKEINDQDYLTSLRAEIRATYFQAIETLFEMVFCLSGFSGSIDNLNLWYLLSTSDWRENYDRISNIAKSCEINFLDKIVIAGKDLEVPLSQYIFYFGVKDQIPADTLQKSISIAKKALILFAQDFAERDEYNAYKHSLRLFPVIKTWEIFTKTPNAPNKPIVTFDLSKSMTFLKEEKDGSLVHCTKPFDTERDYAMSFLCSRLISNIVRSRKAVFLKEGVKLYTFNDEAISSCSKRNVEIGSLTLSIKPIYNDAP